MHAVDNSFEQLGIGQEGILEQENFVRTNYCAFDMIENNFH